MAGNEKEIVSLLIKEKFQINLPYIGVIDKIETTNNSKFIELKSNSDIEAYLKPDDSKKKADIYINENGISLKQKGGSKAFNKFYRKLAYPFFQKLGFQNKHEKIEALDRIVKLMHDGSIGRNHPWQNIFNEKEFKIMLLHLMMKGNLHSYSDYPAKYILVAPKKPTRNSICFYNFDEYFEAKKNLISLAIRRCWTHQNSKSESRRALSIANHENSKPWVFDTISGKSRTGFNNYKKIQKTCYYFDLEIKD